MENRRSARAFLIRKPGSQENRRGKFLVSRLPNKKFQAATSRNSACANRYGTYLFYGYESSRNSEIRRTAAVSPFRHPAEQRGAIRFQRTPQFRCPKKLPPHHLFWRFGSRAD